VQNSRIAAAGCFLPLSEQQDIKKSFGTRHRAALGMTEQSDAVVLIVSEETGAISLAYDAQMYYGLAPSEVQEKLRGLLDRQERAPIPEVTEAALRTPLSAELSAETEGGDAGPARAAETPLSGSFADGFADGNSFADGDSFDERQ
jgi:diadenylate cyclase